MKTHEINGLTLRALRPDDAEALYAIVSDWAVVRQLGGWPWPPDPAFTTSRAKPFDGEGYVWGVIKDERLIGTIGVSKFGGPPSIGYMYDQAVSGCGIASVLCRYCVGVGFAEFDWPEIIAATWHDNPASKRVLEKAGFVHWRTGYEFSKARRAPTLSYDYRLTRQRWESLSHGAH